MTRLFYTGFETGTTEWNGATSTSSTGAISVTSSVKRTGNYSVVFSGVNASSSASFRQVFDADQTELFGRMALRVNSGASQNNWRLLDFHDANNAQQFSLRYDAGTATLNWYDGGGTIRAVGNVLIPADTWVVIEFHTVISASGSATLKVNGTTDAVWTGDTDYTNTGSVRSMYFRLAYLSGGAISVAVYLDDIAINNAEGSYQNSWSGLGGVFYLEPTADGAQNDWTPSAGTVNWQMVDDIPPDNATTFNQALDSGDIDLYEVDDCPEYIASINCLQVAYRAALVTSGYNELTDLVRVGTVNYSGLEYTIVPITPSFTYYLGTIHYLNPSSGSAWGTVEVNAMQAGIEITT